MTNEAPEWVGENERGNPFLLKSMSRVAEVAPGLRPDDVRDGVLASLEGIGMVSHNAGGTFSASGPADPILVVYEVVLRDVGNPVVVATALPESAYNNATGASGFPMSTSE